MSSFGFKKIVAVTLALLAFSACGKGTSLPEGPYEDISDQNPNPDISISAYYPHPEGWANPASHGETARKGSIATCQICHASFEKAPKCVSCHPLFPHEPEWLKPGHGKEVLENGSKQCATQCHGTNWAGGLTGLSCVDGCHKTYPHPDEWKESHGGTAQNVGGGVCDFCHKQSDNPASQVPGCTSCHEDSPHPDSSIWIPYKGGHGEKVQKDYAGSTAKCEVCHGKNLDKVRNGKNCFTCHPSYLHRKISDQWKTFDGHGNYTLLKPTKTSECTVCHGANLDGDAVTRQNPTCYNASCHISFPHPADWALPVGQPQKHAQYVKTNTSSSCATERCHGLNLIPTPNVTKGPNCSLSCHAGYPHPANWKSGALHGPSALLDIKNCKNCHGANLDTAPPGYNTCATCHPAYLKHETAQMGAKNWDTFNGHGSHLKNSQPPWNLTECRLCHYDGVSYENGGLANVSCKKSCHNHESFPHDTANWDTFAGHGSFVMVNLNKDKTSCQMCHGGNYDGGNTGITCYQSQCHATYPHPGDWKNDVGAPQKHGAAVIKDGSSTCATANCHGVNLEGSTYAPTCAQAACHQNSVYPHKTNPLWMHTPYPDHAKVFIQKIKAGDSKACTSCHGVNYDTKLNNQSCIDCHKDGITHKTPEWFIGADHGQFLKKKNWDLTKCAPCHAPYDTGGLTGKGCKTCHESYPLLHTTPWKTTMKGHGTYIMANSLGKSDKFEACRLCHADKNKPDELTGGATEKTCYKCHLTYPHPNDWWDGNWNVPQKHGSAAYGTAKNNCGTVNCHGVNFEGSKYGPKCLMCHPDFPHVNPIWQAQGRAWVAPGKANVHAPTFIEKVKNNREQHCQACHGENYDRVMDGKNCLTCHPKGITHRTIKVWFLWIPITIPWDQGWGHGAHFSSSFKADSPNASCWGCHGAPLPFEKSQTKADLSNQSDCYKCHWAYPHISLKSQFKPNGDPPVPWAVGLAGGAFAHFEYLSLSPLLVDKQGQYLAKDANDPKVFDAIEATCGGSALSCHFQGNRSQPKNNVTLKCAGYCHKQAGP